MKLTLLCFGILLTSQILISVINSFTFNCYQSSKKTFWDHTRDLSFHVTFTTVKLGVRIKCYNLQILQAAILLWKLCQEEGCRYFSNVTHFSGITLINYQCQLFFPNLFEKLQFLKIKSCYISLSGNFLEILDISTKAKFLTN